MEHLASQFNLSTGDTVEVRIDQPTSVRLMDAWRNSWLSQFGGREKRPVGNAPFAGGRALAILGW